MKMISTSFSISLFILCNLVLNASTAEIIIDVGKNNAITFTPQTVTVNVGDKVTWRWHGTQYTVTEADSQGSCVKSTKLGYFDFAEKDNNKVQSFIVPGNSPKRLFYFDKNNCAKGMYGVININSIISVISSTTKIPTPTTSKKPKDSNTSTTSTESESSSPTKLLPVKSPRVKSSSSNLSLIIVLATGGSVLSLVACCAGFMICYQNSKKSGQFRSNNVGMADVDTSVSSSRMEIINDNSFVRPTSSVSSNRGLLAPFDANEILQQSRPNSSSSDLPTIPSRNPSPTRRISNLSPLSHSPFRNSGRSSGDSRQDVDVTIPLRGLSPTMTRQISNLSPRSHSPFGNSSRDSGDSRQDAGIAIPLRSPSPTPTRQALNLSPPSHSHIRNSRRSSDNLSPSPTPMRQVSSLTPPPYSPVTNSRRGNDNSNQDAEILRVPSPIPMGQVSDSTLPPHSPFGNSKQDETAIPLRSPSPTPMCLTPPPYSPFGNSRQPSSNSKQNEIAIPLRSPSPIPMNLNLTPPPHSPFGNSRWDSGNSGQDEIAIPLRSPSPTPMNLTPPPHFRNFRQDETVIPLRSPSPTPMNLTPPPHSPSRDSRRDSGNPRQDAEIAIALRIPSPTSIRRISNLTPSPPVRNSRQSNDNLRQDAGIMIPLRIPSPTPMRLTPPLHSHFRNSTQDSGNSRIPSPTPMNLSPPPLSPTGNSRRGSNDSRQDTEITMESSNGRVLRYSKTVEAPRTGSHSENSGTGNSRNNIKTQSSTELLLPLVQAFPVPVTDGDDENEKVESDPEVMRRLIAREKIFQGDVN